KLRQKGIDVDYLIGFDGDDLGQYMSPKLTTMWQNAEEIGVTAAHQILLRLAGEDLPEIIRVPARLLVRESCAQVRSGR
ncbi:MAG TPA: substrate-binding domain-containing protein, partial [Treponemataceae bacterium]|nr:substrate-binding domain-containing protein [Treponemataceae bacterium]